MPVSRALPAHERVPVWRERRRGYGAWQTNLAATSSTAARRAAIVGLVRSRQREVKLVAQGGGWRIGVTAVLVVLIATVAVLLQPSARAWLEAEARVSRCRLAREFAGSTPLFRESQSVVAGALATSTPIGGIVRGVNLSGAERNEHRLPGTYDQHFRYPAPESLDYFKGKGLTLVRLPFLWERLQPRLFEPFDPVELRRLDAFVAAARARGIDVILDPHNAARYYGQLIGTADVPTAGFADFWRRLATHFEGEPAIWAYDLMNEPRHTGGLWSGAAQAAVDAIRSVDKDRTILVAGDHWSNAFCWQIVNADLWVHDPSDNVMYQAHQYFDGDQSGQYLADYDADRAYPLIGIDRLRPFVEWCQMRGARCVVGEFGVPDDDPRWLDVLDHVLWYLDQNGIVGLYWAGGSFLGDYRLSVEPRRGEDRPQMAVLARYAQRAP
jgi:endoglucanase